MKPLVILGTLLALGLGVAAMCSKPCKQVSNDWSFAGHCAEDDE